MSVPSSQKVQAETFLALHHRAKPFVLGNAWDVISARIFELAGFEAIGTTSAGIASTLGYPDGQQISVQDTADMVARTVRLVNLPISADIEAGYAIRPDEVAEAARVVLRAGAVGINLEDATGDPHNPLFDMQLQVEKIIAVRQMAASEGLHLVINARADAIILAETVDAAAVDDAVARGNAYRQAGADCVFVPDMGEMDRPTLTRLVDEIDAPLNIIAGPNTPPLTELAEIGVARVSLGPRPMRAALAVLRQIAEEIMRSGTFATMSASTLSYSEVNRMLGGEGHD